MQIGHFRIRAIMEDDPRDIGRMIAGLNSNVPAVRRTLMDYIENGNLFYTTKKGETVEFPRAGIDYLASVTNDQEKLTLRLPVFVSTDTASERAAWKIDGRTETAVFARVLGKRVHSEDKLPIYYPDLAELKKKIPGLVFTLFLPRGKLEIYIYKTIVQGFARCVASCESKRTGE